LGRPAGQRSLVDHITDKISATVQRYGDQERPSTRFKDLVDLVAIITEVSVAADIRMAALASEARRRGMGMPASFDVPTVDSGSGVTPPK
jgi:hypothetical protein